MSKHKPKTALDVVIASSEIDVDAVLNSVTEEEKRAMMQEDIAPYLTALGRAIIRKAIESGMSKNDATGAVFTDITMRSLVVMYRMGKESK